MHPTARRSTSRWSPAPAASSAPSSLRHVRRHRLVHRRHHVVDGRHDGRPRGDDGHGRRPEPPPRERRRQGRRQRRRPEALGRGGDRDRARRHPRGRQPHTFVVTLTKDDGNGGYVPAPGEHVDVTLTDANGAVHQPTGRHVHQRRCEHRCERPVHDRSSRRTRRATVTAHASSTLVVGGVTLNVATNGIAPNSGDAVATFVDANIQITPATANNPIGTTHTLTGHVNVNAGTATATRTRPTARRSRSR